MKQLIILASGGLDSYVLAHYLKNRYNTVKILFFDYGQKPLKEEKFCIENLAKEIGAELKIIDLKWLGEISTSLINKNNKTGENEIINWYVPCRNTLFLTAALANAESDFLSNNIESDIAIGIKHEGLGFNDTTPEFLEEINKLAEVCVQQGKYKIIAPFIDKDKEEIIELGNKLKSKLENSYSCYIGAGFKDGIPIHCGRCAGCLARKKGFKFSNVGDKSMYES